MECYCRRVRMALSVSPIAIYITAQYGVLYVLKLRLTVSYN